MQFDINNYPGKYVMHCRTEREARDFCDYLSSLGRTWCSGEDYTQPTNWNIYKADTCYNFNAGNFGNTACYKFNNYTILEWSDFMNKRFTKTDLKTGDVIQRRNGDTEIVNLELGMCIRRSGWNNLNDIRTDLTSYFKQEWDVVAVRRPKEKFDCRFDAFEHHRGDLVYERKEVEEMTLEQVCKLLGKEIKIIK